MSILDFCEIRPTVLFKKRKNEPDAALHFDDFEKFAQEFFQSIYGAKILSPVAREPGGEDFVMEVNVNGIIETMSQ